VFSAICTAEKLDGVVDNRTGDTTTIDVHTLLEACENYL
jgi:hypothetical protein